MGIADEDIGDVLPVKKGETTRPSSTSTATNGASGGQGTGAGMTGDRSMNRVW